MFLHTSLNGITVFFCIKDVMHKIIKIMAAFVRAVFLAFCISALPKERLTYGKGKIVVLGQNCEAFSFAKIENYKFTKVFLIIFE